MPNQYHLPDSSQLESQRSASRPARKEQTPPRRLAATAAWRLMEAPEACAAEV
jgi:hypothetical protein